MEARPERIKGLVEAAAATAKQCGDLKKKYQPYAPKEGYIPKHVREAFRKQKRVRNYSQKLWKMFGIRMARKGMRLDQVSRAWQWRLIQYVKYFKRLHCPNGAVAIEQLIAKNASFAVWLDELRMLEQNYDLASMPGYYYTSAEFARHCCIATRFAINHFGSVDAIPDIVSDDIWPHLHR